MFDLTNLINKVLINQILPATLFKPKFLTLNQNDNSV